MKIAKTILFIIAGLIIAVFTLIQLGLVKTYIIAHDEIAAAKIATNFAENAFISRSYDQAYVFISDAFKKEMTETQFIEGVNQMHGASFPTQVKATLWEAFPGQHRMNIYVNRSNENGKFYYRIIMDGDASTGYKIIGFYRQNTPYEPRVAIPIGDISHK